MYPQLSIEEFSSMVMHHFQKINELSEIDAKDSAVVISGVLEHIRDQNNFMTTTAEGALYPSCIEIGYTKIAGPLVRPVSVAENATHHSVYIRMAGNKNAITRILDYQKKEDADEDLAFWTYQVMPMAGLLARFLNVPIKLV
jgi:hypothetical protein